MVQLGLNVPSDSSFYSRHIANRRKKVETFIIIMMAKHRFSRRFMTTGPLCNEFLLSPHHFQVQAGWLAKANHIVFYQFQMNLDEKLPNCLILFAFIVATLQIAEKSGDFYHHHDGKTSSLM